MNEAVLTAARGDTALAGRLVEELGVTPSAASTANVGWSEYVAQVVGRVMRAVFAFLSRAIEALPLPAGWPRLLALLVVAGALVVLAIVLIRVLRDRRRKRRAADEGSPEVIAGGEGPEAAPELDAAAWRAELEALLAAGRIAEALRAAWWWLARALAGEGADPSWTGRELLERSGRRDLLPIVRRLEAFTYGGRRPEAAELRGLSAEMAVGLARGARTPAPGTGTGAAG